MSTASDRRSLSIRSLLVAALAITATACLPQELTEDQKRAKWAGKGRNRVHIVVPAGDTKPRDHRPASVELNLGETLGGRPDPSPR